MNDERNEKFAERTATAVEAITNMTGSGLGSIYGASVGAAVGGPLGAFAGAAAGTAIEKVFEAAGREIKERILSPRENKRISSVFTLAQHKVTANIAAGRPLRDDGFFSHSDESASPADEALEATLLAAQREYEERKLPYIANLYANIACDPSISRETANYLIKSASEITYRQLVVLMIIEGYQVKRIQAPPRREDSYRHLSSFRAISLATEIFDLYRRSILHSTSSILDAIGITPSQLTLGGNGILLCKLMELSSISLEDPMSPEIFRYLSGQDALPGE